MPIAIRRTESPWNSARQATITTSPDRAIGDFAKNEERGQTPFRGWPRRSLLANCALLGGGVRLHDARGLARAQQAIHGGLRVFPKHQPLGDHVFDRGLDLRLVGRERGIAFLDGRTWIARGF